MSVIHRPVTSFFAALLFVLPAIAADPKAVPVGQAVGGSSKLFVKTLGKPSSKSYNKAKVHMFKVPGTSVYRVEEQDGVVNRLLIQCPVGSMTPDQVLKKYNIKVAGAGDKKVISKLTTTWSWPGAGTGAKVRSVFLRKSFVEVYHDDAIAAGLKPLKDVIYTIIVQGPRPKGSGGGNQLGMGLG